MKRYKVLLYVGLAQLENLGEFKEEWEAIECLENAINKMQFEHEEEYEMCFYQSRIEKIEK